MTDSQKQIEVTAIGEDWDPISCMAALYLHGVAVKPIRIEVIWDAEFVLSSCYTPTHESTYTQEQWKGLTDREQAEYLAANILYCLSLTIGNTGKEGLHMVPTVTYEIVDKGDYVNLYVTITPNEKAEYSNS